MSQSVRHAGAAIPVARLTVTSFHSFRSRSTACRSILHITDSILNQVDRLTLFDSEQFISSKPASDSEQFKSSESAFDSIQVKYFRIFAKKTHMSSKTYSVFKVTKVREILRLNNPFSEKHVIEKAESCAYSELEEYVSEENAKAARARKAATSNLGNEQPGIFDRPVEPQVASTVPFDSSSVPSDCTIPEHNNKNEKVEPGNPVHHESFDSTVSEPQGGASNPGAAGSITRGEGSSWSESLDSNTRESSFNGAATSTGELSSDQKSAYNEEVCVIVLPPLSNLMPIAVEKSYLLD